MMSLTPPLEPGIYFDLPAATYHADNALGSSSIKALAIDPFEFQFDRLYGEDRDTEAMIFGSALHARILEGRKAFEAQFCQTMDPKLVPDGALDTVEDLKAFLSARDARVSGRKADLIERALALEPRLQIVDVIKQKWDAANAGKVQLKPKRWAQVEVASKWTQRDPLLSAVMEDGTFKAGAPEVSIFYEDRGVRLKCRLDRLLRHAILDLKSFAPIFDGRIEQQAIKAINRMNHPIQAAAYLRGWQHARKLHEAGRVFGEEPHEGFLTECFDRPEPKWIWIMIKSTGAPQPLVIDWSARIAMSVAAQQVEDAISTYIELREMFGDNAEWPPMRPAMTLEDQDLPAFFGV